MRKLCWAGGGINLEYKLGKGVYVYIQTLNPLFSDACRINTEKRAFHHRVTEEFITLTLQFKSNQKPQLRTDEGLHCNMTYLCFLAVIKRLHTSSFPFTN